MSSFVVRNARVMTCDPARPGLGIIERGAVAVVDGKVAWVGDDIDWPTTTLALGFPREPSDRSTLDLVQWQTIDAGGKLVTPGLVDCHTHAIFAGDRANEFALRAQGKGYLEIAAAGGGIVATTGPTRRASDDELLALLTARLDAALAAGTTTIEIKSGYDLTVAGELRLLRCIATAAKGNAPFIVPTLLAHVVPAERANDRDAYVRGLCRELIPEAAAQKLATSVDVYCDEGAFTLAETRALWEAAKEHGLAVRGHVGQFADLGGADLLAELGGLSADHLEQISAAGIAALARANVVAIMLPGACVQLRLPVPPVADLRRAGVRLALGSDLNPGSSYCDSLVVPMWLATTHYQMSVEEAWLAVTRNAAAALAVDSGRLAVGARGDLVIWRSREPAEIPYRYTANLVEQVLVGAA
jgi:imidazolonepropionase